MAGLTRLNRQFVKRYSADHARLQDVAASAERLVKSILKNSRLDIHTVTARAKSPSSMLLKILKKSYADPSRQLTDAIGVRVITYHAADVDKVVELLKQRFRIDSRRSVDKRVLLGRQSFGYSSVHLIVKITRADTGKLGFASLADTWFEIQIRSILEHAWAEIEHEVVLKSEVAYPKQVLRRFAALAATLEMLGAEFLALKLEKNRLIEECRQSYSADADLDKTLDVSRLLGFLESAMPDNLSWRGAESSDRGFPPRIEATCLMALRSCGLTTARKLRRIFRSRKFRIAVRTFAAATGTDSSGLSHLALVVIAVALKSRALLRDFFPEMVGDPGIRAVSALA